MNQSAKCKHVSRTFSDAVKEEEKKNFINKNIQDVAIKFHVTVAIKYELLMVIFVMVSGK